MLKDAHNADMCFTCFPRLAPVAVAHFQPAAHTTVLALTRD